MRSRSAMMLFAMLMATADQEPAHAVANAVKRPAYLVIGDEAFRDLVATAIGRTKMDARPHDGSGLTFASCMDAWRGDRAETSACIQSRMPVAPPQPLVVIHSAAPPGPVGAGDAICITASEWRAIALSEKGAQPLRRCLAVAGKAAPAATAARFSIAPSGLLATNERRASQRDAATSVISIAVDHAALPRGLSGPCHVSGRIRSVRRGPGLSPRGTVELSIPCVSRGGHGAGQRVDMGEFEAGSYADLYLDSGMRLIDYRRTDR